MRKVLYLLFISVILHGCSNVEVFNGKEIRQYANKVIGFSSQYTSSNWSADRALGQPNVYPTYGDKTDAWASVTADGNREFLVLGFGAEQTVRTIEIYETYNPGAVDSLFIRNAATKLWKKFILNLPYRTYPQNQEFLRFISKKPRSLLMLYGLPLTLPQLTAGMKLTRSP